MDEYPFITNYFTVFYFGNFRIYCISRLILSSMFTFTVGFVFSSTFSLAGDSLVESDLLPVDILDAVLFNET